MKKILLFLLPALATTMVMTACEVGSADDVAPIVNSGGNIIVVNGVYRNSNSNENFGAFVSPANSGTRVTQLNLRQNGNNLEATDNNNIVFKGSIGSVINNGASFNLTGNTTAGNSVKISGTIGIQSSQGTMRATWIENGLYATVYGVADGPTVITNSTGTATSDLSAAISADLNPVKMRELIAGLIRLRRSDFYTLI